jgi:Ran GTPase-activating protein (RanGAP) involved in mRNA processing and transport
LESPHTLLSHIYLAGNYIGNAGAKDLAEGLSNNDRAMALDLTNNEIRGKAGAEQIYYILSREGNQLKRIVLSKNPFGNSGIEKISNALGSYQCRLHYLNLTDCDFNHIGAKSLYSAIRVCHYLKTLILDKNDLGGPSTVVL